METTAKEQSQAEYLNKIKVYLKMLRQAAIELNKAWMEDDKYDLDLDDFLAKLYPFGDSFHELTDNINHWVEDYIEQIKDYDVMRPFVVTAERIPDYDQLNGIDQDCYDEITEPYHCNARTSEAALDHFHESVPIKVLDDFEITVKECSDINPCSNCGFIMGENYMNCGAAGDGVCPTCGTVNK